MGRMRWLLARIKGGNVYSSMQSSMQSTAKRDAVALYFLFT